MKKHPVFILLALSLIVISCKSTILRIAGVREPRIENKVSIFRFLNEIGQDTSNVYVMDSNLMDQLKKKSFKPGMSKAFRPIQVRVYDKKGNPVIQWASCEGYLQDLKLFDTVPPRVINGLDTSLNLVEDLSRYYTFEGKPAGIIPAPGFDYYFIVYFARYFPKMSKESFLQVDQYMKHHPELTFRLYKINVDVQEFWGVDLQIDTEVNVGGKK
jgi:hypothetical protein